jgi:integrase
MKTITFKVVFNQFKKNDKEKPLHIRITYNGLHRYLPTGYNIPDKDWNEKKKEVSERNPIKNRVDKMIVLMKELRDKYRAENKVPSFVDFENLFKPKQPEAPTLTFTDFFKAEIEKNKKITVDTKQVHRNVFNQLSLFKPILSMKEVDEDLASDFENFLIDKGKKPNTRKKYQAIIGKYVYLAVRKKLIDKNTFNLHKIKKQETKRRALFEYEIKRLENLVLKPSQSHLELTKDIYLFGCYTGLRISDMLTLTRQHLNINGNDIILKKVMEKSQTEKAVTLKLHALKFRNPIPLLQKYLKLDLEKIFPKISEAQINRNLKFLAELAEIERPEEITIHTSRHSFAINTYAVTKDILELKKYLGHSKLDTTMIYLKMYEEMI